MSDLLRELEIVRSLTPARLSLRSAGASPTTAERLAFAADHALTRDAVRRPLDAIGLEQSLLSAGFSSTIVSSRAATLNQHLLRTDLGRRVDPDDLTKLAGAFDLVYVVADGLSSGAVEKYAPRVLATMDSSAVVIVRHGRVAIGDEVGERLSARLAVVLIGERPGLSAPESLGIYLTYEPKIGRTDAERYCLSNVRDSGTPPETAATILRALIERSLAEGKTGV